MSIIFGLLAALSFGIADFFLPKASKEEGSLQTLYYTQLVGGLYIALILLVTTPDSFRLIFTSQGLITALIGLEMALGYAMLIKAFSIGPMLLVSPISSSFAVFTLLFSIIVSGEHPSSIHLLGLIICLVGIIFTATTNIDFRTTKLNKSGLFFSFSAAVFIGIGFWLLRFVVGTIGSQTAVVIMRFSTFLFLSIFILIMKRPIKLNRKTSIKWLIIIGILNTSGSMFYNMGLLIGMTSIVSVITSLYSVVTVLGGYFFLSQRLSKLQFVGIITTIIGIGIVSL